MSAFDNDGGADAASAESARQALLLATQALGVNAAAVREERERRCAAEQQLNWLLGLFIEAEDGADTLLSRAAEADNEHVLGYALSHGANVNATPFWGGLSALHQASQASGPTCLRRLLEAGADIEKADDGGMTGLHWAAGCGQSDCLRMLLEAGAEKDKPDNEGQTPMYCAVDYLRLPPARREIGRCGHHDCLKLLLEAGADQDKADNCGWTPLHAAARNPPTTPDVLKLLLQAGANTSARNEDGLTALQLAEADGNDKTAALLREHGAIGAL